MNNPVPTTTTQPRLTIVEWGILPFGDVHSDGIGNVAALNDIPAGTRRRLGQFERAVVRAVLGASQADQPAHVTLGSRYGNLQSTAAILDALAHDTPPSPTQFSYSVLNAACGIANQVRKDRTSHTAVAAGALTVHGALTDAWLRAGDEPQRQNIVVLADAPLPEIYQPLDDGWQGGICIGLNVRRAPHGDTPAPCSLGRSGYAALAQRLQAGDLTLGLSGGQWTISA
ncbi:MAG: beta-ketoacyl synthase chain length factor [Pikeienuella sp.]